jgi:hypothetical protein
MTHAFLKSQTLEPIIVIIIINIFQPWRLNSVSPICYTGSLPLEALHQPVPVNYLNVSNTSLKKFPGLLVLFSSLPTLALIISKVRIIGVICFRYYLLEYSLKLDSSDPTL